MLPLFFLEFKSSLKGANISERKHKKDKQQNGTGSQLKIRLSTIITKTVYYILLTN